MKRIQGRIADWKDDRGFGFIAPDDGSTRVFFHINALGRGARRPYIGEMVSFEISAAQGGKINAINVRRCGFAAIAPLLGSRRMAFSAVAVSFFALLWWLAFKNKIPAILIWVFAGMSTVAFCMYGLDKLAAKRDQQRTQEFTLQLCALLGGWPGALLGQQAFRHKSSKRSFQVVFWVMVAANCAILGWIASPAGSAFLRGTLALR